MIRDLLDGGYTDPMRIVAFNNAKGWSRDVTTEIAAELKQCSVKREDIPPSLQYLLEMTTGVDLLPLERPHEVLERTLADHPSRGLLCVPRTQSQKGLPPRAPRVCSARVHASRRCDRSASAKASHEGPMT